MNIVLKEDGCLIDQIPRDLRELIWSCLPSKTVYRLRLVSKSWKGQIENPRAPLLADEMQQCSQLSQQYLKNKEIRFNSAKDALIKRNCLFFPCISAYVEYLINHHQELERQKKADLTDFLINTICSLENFFKHLRKHYSLEDIINILLDERFFHVNAAQVIHLYVNDHIKSDTRPPSLDTKIKTLQALRKLVDFFKWMSEASPFVQDPSTGQMYANIVGYVEGELRNCKESRKQKAISKNEGNLYGRLMFQHEGLMAERMRSRNEFVLGIYPQANEYVQHLIEAKQRNNALRHADRKIVVENCVKTYLVELVFFLKYISESHKIKVINSQFFEGDNSRLMEDYVDVFLQQKYKNQKTISKKLYNLKAWLCFCLETELAHNNSAAADNLKRIIEMVTQKASHFEKSHTKQQPPNKKKRVSKRKPEEASEQELSNKKTRLTSGLLLKDPVRI